MSFKAAAFVRWSGAAVGPIHLGHVGWGFQISESQFMCGSLENVAGDMFRFGPGNTGAYWYTCTSSFGGMIGAMRDMNAGNSLLHLSGDKRLPKYDEYKYFDVNRPNVEVAKQIAFAAARPGIFQTTYVVLGQNCLDLTNNILYNYGYFGPFGMLTAPLPSRTLSPSVWYNAIMTESYQL